MKKTLVMAGAIALLALAAPAYADDVTHGNNGILTGSPIHLPITAVVPVCGNNIGIQAVPINGCQGSPNTAVYSR
ncbi:MULTISPECIES: chaplin family protein [Nonomuraea]|uniref:Chaplin family protein n=1 Tax=Nonomuraea spiralis TaxID=46182 RepID=A0ABV5ISV8_9ACTN|nr:MULTISPECIES: chaplin family protein [Nonomuraea]